MDFLSNLPHAAKAAIGLAAVYAVYQLLTTITLWAGRRDFKRERGVLDAPWLPQRDRFYGIDLFLDNIKALKEHRFLELGYKRFTETGLNTMQLVALGRHMHMTTEPENLKTIQAIDHKKWGLGKRRKIGFAPLLGAGIFTTDGAEWQHSREMLRPNFVRSQVGDLATFEKHVSNLIAAVPADGATVDLSDLFFRLTIDSATEFLFGESTESLTKNSSEGFAEAFTYSQDFIAHRSRWGMWAKLLKANDRFEKDRKFVHDFVDYFVQKGLAKRDTLLAEKGKAETSGRYVFMDELVRQTTDPIRIRSELLNILLAGRDTTASLLTNTWFMLSKRPDIWTKLQADIATLNGAKPTFEQLKNLKYLKALLNESLRLHPVVPQNSREALEDTTLPLGGGPDGRAPIFIKKGEIMAWNVYAMHRRKDYYGQDAEEFRPERWLDDPDTGKKGLRPGWEYLPFNGGARICLGQQFALTEASYATVRLCQAFAGIESRDEEEVWVEHLTLTCVSLNGARVGLTSRGGG
ncbi:Cytochrome P450 monooxygenase himC [Fulvia fulva]|uniref:Cytochrome P450 monooxygenase himC n=1 Tax=Passalora fulva TaxID=5499 RepID=A0A9Q8UUV3_PASFU|nr:Cytochrome P450 monooxygenase himC [Fulvia fulva]KAK4626189.1 Cytochrome P450 monooxygenase himC [Fulvia fulva]KAK4628146.1 Cytochrome P450 monooxygenase himC [Fulvia fulva]UJO23275.1 Cytochrome P450 monooxygenase himC [Fulvia fulva]WPV13256.1 Cytochrome P450 monooxygenase himC [Fulvia fulva]WPV29190.1 Cytochrome P450 monooxygenase himC [Fulvia fulva]